MAQDLRVACMHLDCDSRELDAAPIFSAPPLRVPPPPPQWSAQLCLKLERVGECTRLVHNRHSGPLRVQRALYPEGPTRAHALILHPPGGIAGGDELDIQIELAAEAKVLCTTPGASKWYHGDRAGARQSQLLRVGADACLEWLPQESILFDGACAAQSTLIEIDPAARCFGWDIVQLGRLSADECWTRGRWRQRLVLRRGGRERWREVSDLRADDPLRESALGLAGNAVMATAWAVAPNLKADQAELVERLRAIADGQALACGISWLPDPSQVLLIRVLGQSSAMVRALLEQLWGALRPCVARAEAHRPRIWET